MSDNPCLKYINMIKATNRLLRASCYLDGECKKIDAETFEVNGLRFKIPKEWQEYMIGYIDNVMAELIDAAKRVGMLMIPISIVVLRIWVTQGQGMSPCVIYHVIKDYLKRVGFDIKEMKALGEEYIVVKKGK